MSHYIIKNTLVINEGQERVLDIEIKDQLICKIGQGLSSKSAVQEIDGAGHWLIPGVIDTHVHFREPGLTHKATIYSESRAAVKGGVTSFIDMPNTVPPCINQTLLEEKFNKAAQTALANYSFYMAVNNDNSEEAIKLNTLKNKVAGLKMFLGSVTGSLLIDQDSVIEKVLRNSELLIATHCEDESIVARNKERLQKEVTEWMPMHHALVRDEAACYSSSSKIINIAKKTNARLHILHLTTGKEISLFDSQTPLANKKITCEVCVPHLYFSDQDYKSLGNKIKCNPAIKTESDKEQLWRGLLDNHIDMIATDHAPHTQTEKASEFWKAPSGIPMIQHSLPLLLKLAMQQKLTKIQLVQKMCHAPAICYQIEKRGFIREGYFADIAIINPNKNYIIAPTNIAYQCGWSPLEGLPIPCSITHTFVNGHLAYHDNKLNDALLGRALDFKRS
ncbi:MAG: dihydroorotase [Phycisphaerales bacterium]|nr:dihydroorotase [Phycisphaerales bacterium]